MARRGLLGPMVVMAATFLTFWPVAGFAFVQWDDDINITKNPLLTAPWSWDLVKRMFASDLALRFEPLHWLIFRGLHDAFGLDPTAWHVANLALHTAAAGLLVLVLRRVFALSVPGANPVRREFAAGAGALVWAVHPLRAEVVGWATASTYAQTAVFLLASFWCYLRAAEGAQRCNRDAAIQPGRRWIWLIAAWILAAAGYASYPVGVTYPLWLMVVDRWLLRPRALDLDPSFSTDLRGSFRRALGFAVPALAALALTVWARFATPGIFNAAPNLSAAGLPVRLPMVFASLTYMAARVVWPGHLTPNMPPLLLSASVLVVIFLAAAAALFALLTAWRRRVTRPGLTLVLFGMVAIGVPCLGWTERPTWPVDRYTYLVDLVLIGGIAGWALARTANARWVGSSRATMLGLLVFAAAAIAGRAQVLTWRDTRTLLSHLTRDPDFAENRGQAAHVYLMWARSEIEQGKHEEAASLLQRAREFGFLGIREAVTRGDYERALATLGELEPYFTLTPLMRREKADWLLRTGRVQPALAELQQVEKEMPGDPRTRELRQQAEAAVARSP